MERIVDVNGLRMQVFDEGRGTAVLFVHGFPELPHSWRAQRQAVAAAGFRAIAPAMRGYGGTDAPAEVERYSMLHLVGDLVGLLKALDVPQAVLVGHDWGAAVAWMAALLRPDRFPAVVGMSVPYTPPSRTDLLSAIAAGGVDDFYLQYFQTPGVAEAELEADLRESLRRIHWSASGESPSAGTFTRLGTRGLLAHTARPERMPAWMTEADLDVYVDGMRRGLAGPLAWYRNLRRNTELLAPWIGMPVRQPSLFIAGTRDDVLQFPAATAQIAAYPRTLPGLRGLHLLDGAGHWVQRERAAEVNALLLEFLRALER